jgi:hypothetical protein
VKINYSGEKRRRELALKQKKEEKAKKMAERKTLRAQQTEGTDPTSDEVSSDANQDDEGTTKDLP